MNDFLTFLNSADVDTFTKTPGITRPLAESLAAARPFAVVEDALKVRGMGKNLLARLQSTFEAQENAGEGRGLIVVQNEAMPALVEASRPKINPPVQEEPSFWSRLGGAFLGFVRAVLRLIAFVIVVGGIGLAILYGVPYLQNKFIAPVEQNTAKIDNLSSELTNLRNQNAALQTQLDEMNGRVATLETTIQVHTTSLAQLEEMQSTLDKNMKTGDKKLGAGLQEGEAKIMLELKREIALTRSIEFLSRARLYLSESNFGLAKDDVQAARDVLIELQSADPEYKPGALKQVITRLDLALGNLPAFPVIASGDVDIALQLLMDDLPQGAAELTATPTPVVDSTPTAVSTLLPEPTLPPTPTP
jgi:hypothetical protein